MLPSIKKLAELKVKLVTTTDFHETFHYFFDHFGENDEFMRAGHARHNARLQEVLANCAQPILKQSVITMRNTVMVYIREHKFYHGALTINNIMANFFYFQDIDSGLMALAVAPEKGETIIARFSLHVVGAPPEEFPN